MCACNAADEGASVEIINCSFTGSGGNSDKHADSVYICGDGGDPCAGPAASGTFMCKASAAGPSVNVSRGKELRSSDLPPSKEVVHCS